MIPPKIQLYILVKIKRIVHIWALIYKLYYLQTIFLYSYNDVYYWFLCYILQRLIILHINIV